MYVDSHCHIHLRDLAKRQDEVLHNMAASQVSHALCVTIVLADFPAALGTGGKNRYHPFDSRHSPNPDPKDVGEVDTAKLVELARHPKVVAIGETGLDYYRVKPRQKWQMDRFRAQIRASVKSETSGHPYP